MRFNEIYPCKTIYHMISEQTDVDGPFMGSIRKGWMFTVEENGGMLDVVAYKSRQALQEGRSCLRLEQYDPANLRLLQRGSYLHEEQTPQATYFHVTLSKNIPSIMRKGLVPKIGTLSKMAGESRKVVYLFPDALSAEDAVVNWMGDNLPEDEPLALLKVTLPVGWATRVDGDAGYEFTVDQTIPPSSIEVVTDDLG